MDTVTPEFVATIFYSGQFSFTGDKEISNKIAFLVNNGYLSLKKVYIASNDAFMDIMSAKTLESSPEADGGSFEHRALKLLSGKYLSESLGLESKYEVPFSGYIPDVISIDSTVICECGHTNNPEKIFEYFKSETVKEIIQVPYPTEKEDVMGFIFTKGNDLIPFLEFEYAHINKNILGILNRNI